MQHYRDKKVLVLGMGVSGKAAAQLLLNCGALVWAIDQNARLLEHDPEIETLRKQGLNPLWEALPADPVGFSLVVLSPGVPQTHPVCVWAKKMNIRVS